MSTRTAIELADVERPLALFAQGISGRPYQIQPEDAFDGSLERIEGAALHNPTTLFLPGSFGLYTDRAANLGALRLVALHQLCYREFGSHAFSLAEARARCAPLAVRRAPELGPRESDLTALFAHFANPALARVLFRIVEAARIDGKMRRRYPGIEPHYARFAAYERARRGHVAIVDLSSLLEALILAGLGVDPSADAPDHTGLLDALSDELGTVTHPDADVYTTTEVMTRCYEVLETSPFVGVLADDVFESPEIPAIHGDTPLEWLQRGARVERWRDDLAAAELSLDELEALELEEPTEGLGMGGMSAPLIDPPEGRATSAAAAGGDTRPEGLEADANRRELEDQRDSLTRRIDMEHASLRTALGAPAHPGKSFLYDEWDNAGERYLRAWCRLYEIPLEPQPSAPDDIDLRRVATLREAVRRRFEQLKPEAYARTRKVLEGVDLDWDQVIAYRVDRHRTASPDDRVYVRHDRTSRDVSALFLVDLSASTDDPVDPPESPAHDTDPDAVVNLRDPFDDDSLLWSSDLAAAREPRRRIIDVQREALILMADALDRLGDRFGVFGFSGYGRECVEFYLAKDFNAPWNARALKALAAMRPRRSTRMGPAIRHATRRLNRAGGALKVMIIVSDGFPQDCDYGPDRSSHDYGVADTAKAIEEAERAGITTFCITVDRSGHDYLKSMCDERRYMVIDEIETLPDALSKVYEALTT